MTTQYNFKIKCDYTIPLLHTIALNSRASWMAVPCELINISKSINSQALQIASILF